MDRQSRMAAERHLRTLLHDTHEVSVSTNTVDEVGGGYIEVSHGNLYAAVTVIYDGEDTSPLWSVRVENAEAPEESTVTTARTLVAAAEFIAGMIGAPTTSEPVVEPPETENLQPQTEDQHESASGCKRSRKKKEAN